MSLFSPAWKSDNKIKALKAVAKCKKDNQLLFIVFEAPLEEVRLAALNKIKDLDTLTIVALQSDDSEISKLAIEQIENSASGKADEALLRIADEKINTEIGNLALNSIKDQKILMEIATRREYWYTNAKNEIWSSNHHIAFTALNKITDQTVLAETARNYVIKWQRDREKKIKAKEKYGLRLNNGSLLHSPYYDDDWYVDSEEKLIFTAILNKLNDDKTLAELAVLIESEVTYKQIIKRIKNTDAVLTTEVKLKSPVPYVRKSAVNGLIDKSILERIATNDPDSSVRFSAVKKLNDQDLLAQFARKTEESFYFRIEALKSLTDQSVLADIAKNDKDSEIRDAAIEQITDQKMLAEIALASIYSRLKKKLFKEITEKEALLLIAKSGETDDLYKTRYYIIAINQMIELGYMDAETSCRLGDTQLAKATMEKLTLYQQLIKTEEGKEIWDLYHKYCYEHFYPQWEFTAPNSETVKILLIMLRESEGDRHSDDIVRALRQLYDNHPELKQQIRSGANRYHVKTHTDHCQYCSVHIDIRPHFVNFD